MTTNIKENFEFIHKKTNEKYKPISKEEKQFHFENMIKIF